MSFCCTYEGIEPKKNMTVDFICCFLGLKTIQATPPKHDLVTSSDSFSKFLTSTPVLFIWKSLSLGVEEQRDSHSAFQA